MNIKRIDEIEDMIARGQMNAAQVFTQMKQVCQDSYSEIPNSSESVGIAQSYNRGHGMTQCVFTAKAVPVGSKLYTQPASCPEIPDSLEPASRKTFEGEPVAIVDRVGIMQRCAPYSNLAEGTKLYTYAEWADAKAGERPMNDNMFKNIKKRSLKSIFDQLLSTAERDTYWNSKEQLKLKLLECGVLASEIQRRVIEDPALAGEPVGYTCKKTIAAARQGARNSLASFYAKSEGDVNVGLYTHPASCSEIPDSPATGNAVAMGDLTDNDDEEYERSILIQFASVEDFHGARSSGQCRFTVFGGGV